MPLPKWQVPLHFYTGITVCTGVGKWLQTLHYYSALGEPEGFSWGTVTNCTWKASISGSFNESTWSYNQCKSQQNCSGFYVTEFQLYTVRSKCFQSLTPKHTKLLFFFLKHWFLMGQHKPCAHFGGNPLFHSNGQTGEDERWKLSAYLFHLLVLVCLGVLKRHFIQHFQTCQHQKAKQNKQTFFTYHCLLLWKRSLLQSMCVCFVLPHYMCACFVLPHYMCACFVLPH